MSWRRELSKLRAIFRRDKTAHDVAEEIQAHIRMEENENVAAGMSGKEAHDAALRRFGNVTLSNESSRDSWGWAGAETLLQDARFGLRQLGRNRGFTLVAVLTLTLGIGATTAIFSVVNSVLLKPLPFKNPDKLVELFETEEAPGDYPLSGADYLDWQKENRTLEGTSLFSWTQSMSASGSGEPEAARVVSTQANFFDVLGVQPFKGRAFAAGEDTAGKNRVAIVDAGFAQRHFGSTDVLGKTVVLNNESHTVIGVMPTWFSFHGPADIWIPLDMSPKELGPRGNHNWNAVGRIKESISLEQARADLLGISKRLEQMYHGSNNRVHAELNPLKETIIGDSRSPLLVILGAVLMVLLIACVNVANLQLARASARYREMAVRSSLGAGRFRLIRQMLTESVLLSFAGAVFGMLGAWWCVRLLQAAKNLPIPRANPIQVDSSVLLFTLAVSLLAGILFGLAPALQRYDLFLGGELRAGAQSVLGASQIRQRLRDGLVVAEICLTVALLVEAGLLLRSFERLRSTDIGVNPRNVLTMTFNLPKANYPNLPARRHFFNALLERAQQTQGIESATVSTEIPLDGGSNGYINLDGNTNPEMSRQLVEWNFITPGYFHTLQIPLVEGRNFTEQDVEQTAAASQKFFALFANAPDASNVKIPADIAFVTIISEGMARFFWPKQDAVGQSYRWNDTKVTVIGVVRDVKPWGIRAKVLPEAYYPLPIVLGDMGYGRLTIRTRIPPMNVLSPIRRQVRSLDSGLAMFNPITMDELIAQDTHDVTVQAFLLGSFAILALILAAIGLYGVMAYLVTQRTREIGIRMALGAQQSNVLTLIMSHGAKLTLIGVVSGVLAALALTRSMAALLFGVSATDPLTFFLVAGLLAAVALVAYYVPARRATKVDPMLALRYE